MLEIERKEIQFVIRNSASAWSNLEIIFRCDQSQSETPKPKEEKTQEVKTQDQVSHNVERSAA